jgi:hypothetical protein
MTERYFIPADASASALVYSNGKCERRPVIAWQMAHTGRGWIAVPVFTFEITPTMAVAVDAGGDSVTCGGVLYPTQQTFADAIRGA